VVLLPADHYVHDEAVFAHALRKLGYIVPEHSTRYQPSRMIEFVEKPPLEKARALLARGALWNAFIVASSAYALLGLYGERFVSTIVRMRHAVDRHQNPTFRASVLAELYRELPSRDFSRDVLEGQESRLQVLPVPSCGWTGSLAIAARETPRARSFVASEIGTPHIEQTAGFEESLIHLLMFAEVGIAFVGWNVPSNQRRNHPADDRSILCP
jgi:hypothetical protein